MKKTKLKIFGLLITVTLLIATVSCLALTAGATGETANEVLISALDGSGATEVDTIENALEQLGKAGGGKIKLLTDVSIEYQLRFEDHEYELDLNGKKLTNETAGVINLLPGATLKITDSDYTGTVVTNAEGHFAITSYGLLTLEGGAYIGSGGIFCVSYEGTPSSLTANDASVLSFDYAALDNRGTAVLNGGSYSCIDGQYAIENGGDLTINGSDVEGKAGICNIKGKVTVNSGTISGTEKTAVYMIDGELEVTGGTFRGCNHIDNTKQMTVEFSGGSAVFSGGHFPRGFAVLGATLGDVVEDGVFLFDMDLNMISTDGITEVADGVTILPDRAAVTLDGNYNLIESYDSVSAAFADENDKIYYIFALRDSDEDFVISMNTIFSAGKNTLSGDVENNGSILGGSFTGKVTNNISSTLHGGNYSGEITNYGLIFGGHIDCKLYAESDSEIINDRHNITLGDGFEYVSNGGYLTCKTHIGEATCVSAPVCGLCGECFGEIDPNAHVFDSDGICQNDGCGVKATLMRGGKFYTSYLTAMAEADPGDVIFAIGDFETDGLSVEEGIVFNATGYTVTVLDGYDMTVYGTVHGGTFRVADGRVIAIEARGSIDGGSFYGEVINSGNINGGSFYGVVNNITVEERDGTIRGGDFYKDINNSASVITENVITLHGDAKLLDMGGSVYCDRHYGGTATCTDGAYCDFCGHLYTSPIPHADSNIDHICDNGCGEILTEHSDTDSNGYCDECGETVESAPETSDPSVIFALATLISAGGFTFFAFKKPKKTDLFQ